MVEGSGTLFAVATVIWICRPVGLSGSLPAFGPLYTGKVRVLIPWEKPVVMLNGCNCVSLEPVKLSHGSETPVDCPLRYISHELSTAQLPSMYMRWKDQTPTNQRLSGTRSTLGIGSAIHHP